VVICLILKWDRSAGWERLVAFRLYHTKFEEGGRASKEVGGIMSRNV